MSLFGVLAAPAQGRPSDMLIDPALYAVVNAPFAATVEWTWNERRADGTEVHHRTVSRVLRDSAGRQRFEDGEDEAGGAAAGVRIYDVTMHGFTRLDPAAHKATLSWMQFTSTGRVAVAASSGGAPAPEPRMDGVTVEGDTTREPLGRRNIAALDADGVRTTRVIPPGKEKNDAEVRVVDEVWLSPEWRLPLLHTHDDPRTGRAEAQVTEFLRKEPDAALFQTPAGYTVDNLRIGRALSKVSPLPSPILDDNLAAAADRMQAAATAHDATVTALHVRYELRMVDMLGKEHAGTMEAWNSPAGFRFEAHTDGYNEIRVLKGDHETQFLEGEEPLRMREFEAIQLGPAGVTKRLLKGGTIPRLKLETEGKKQLLCAKDAGTTVACFDQETGFVASAAMDADGLAYKDWKKAGWLYRAGEIRMLHEDRLLLEAKLAAADTEVPDSVFQAAPGGKEIARRPGQIRFFALPGPLRLHDFTFTRAATDSNAPLGRVQVRVSLSEAGKVMQASVVDADDLRLSDPARRLAELSTLPPQMRDGRREPSDTSVFYQWLMPGAEAGSGPAAGALGGPGNNGFARVGGNVSAPVVLSMADPKFSEEARQNRVSGAVSVSLEVDERGLPINVRVIRGIGHGLDEKAVEAVKQYKFKPAMRDGTPVRVQMKIQVNFQIFP